MYPNMVLVEIMAKARCEDIARTSSGLMVRRRFRRPWARRTLVRVGGFLVGLGMALEKFGVGQEVYNLSTTASR